MTRALQFVLRSGRNTRQNSMADRHFGPDATNKNNGVAGLNGGVVPAYEALAERLDSVLEKMAQRGFVWVIFA